MKNIFLYFFLILAIIGCNSKIKSAYNPHSWNFICVNKLRIQFEKYEHETLLTCADKGIKSTYEMFTYLIFQFNYEKHKNKVDQYTRRHHIQYDSIYMVNNYYAGSHIRDFPTITARWYLVKNGVIFEELYTKDYDGTLKILKSDKPYWFLQRDLKRVDGCDDTIVIVTVIKPNNDLEIVHMALNPDYSYNYTE